MCRSEVYSEIEGNTEVVTNFEQKLELELYSSEEGRKIAELAEKSSLKNSYERNQK